MTWLRHDSRPQTTGLTTCHCYEKKGKTWWSFIVQLGRWIEHVAIAFFFFNPLIPLPTKLHSPLLLFKSLFTQSCVCLSTWNIGQGWYVFVNLLSKARTRTAVGIHQRERVGAGRPLSPAGNWRMLINCSKWRTIFRNRVGSNLSIWN